VAEHPILFSAPMIRAILAGAKTQTRRGVRPQPTMPTDAALAAGVYGDLYDRGPQWAFWLRDARMTEPRTWRCPFGAAGDLLWVRETWCGPTVDEVKAGALPLWVYRATHGDEDGLVERWRSPIFMPRRASRITLAVESVRVERVQAITDADIAAEGVTTEAARMLWNQAPAARRRAAGWPLQTFHPRDAWRLGWMVLHGAESWTANPWVWAVTFQRVA